MRKIDFEFLWDFEAFIRKKKKDDWKKLKSEIVFILERDSTDNDNNDWWKMWRGNGKVSHIKNYISLHL